MRFGVTQQNLERTRCDELGNLYVFSLESIFKALKSYKGEESLDEWVQNQTNVNGLAFRQRFAAYMASKYPITGRARIPDRFQKRWSSEQKKIFRGWLRQRTPSEISAGVKLTEEEVTELLEDVLSQLEEAGLLKSLEQGVRLEAFQQRERRTYEGQYRRRELSVGDDTAYMTDGLDNVTGTHPEAMDEMLLRALQTGVGHAFSGLSAQERRLLALKFDAEWTLREIAERGHELGLEKATEKQVGHTIDSILRNMLPAINKALGVVEDVNLELPGLKKVLLEWGTDFVQEVR